MSDGTRVDELYRSLKPQNNSDNPADIYRLRDEFVRARLKDLGYNAGEPAKYIHQLCDWPKFRWNYDALADKIAGVRYKQSRLAKRMESLEPSQRSVAVLETLTLDVHKTSEIEGETLNKDHIRSAMARRLGMGAGDMPAAPAVEGVVSMVHDVSCNFRRSLTKERLFKWHASLFPPVNGRVIRVSSGAWRTDEKGPMLVVSGPIGSEHIHYEAPAADRLEQEMAVFLDWLNSEDATNPLLRAGIAHFWFVTVHPFEDGNGRIARAIADMMLARSEESPQRFYSLSAQIWRNRRDYYNMLEDAQKGTLDITEPLIWFLNCLDRALDAAEARVTDILRKARL